MHMPPHETDIDDEQADRLVSAARTSLGDTLRSVVYFTPSAFDVLYVRSDIYDSEDDARTAKGRLVEMEMVGFAERPLRDAIGETALSAIGPYEFTVRFHDDGFVARVIEGNSGVLMTTDSMEVNAFEEAATSVRALLQE
jgi:hypothetical protein